MLMKRTLDLTITLLSLPVVAPAVLACVAAIRLTSSGPGIFRQTRIGLHEQPFTCYKLRTMSVDTGDTPSHETPATAVTPIGRWLRQLKLDELPQLWNIVRGEMSFVGPRPCLPSQTELIAARRRLGLYTLRPGITGVSQVAGIDMSDPERLARSDSAYLNKISIGTDIRLILATILGAGYGDKVGSKNLNA
ncbi:MAG: sugar transferase [Variibacter sp.]